MSTLLDRQRRGHVVGHIRQGELAVSSGGKNYPSKRNTYRLTSPNKAVLDMAAKVYGGEVMAWSPNGKPMVREWKLDTDATSLRCVVSADASVQQRYERFDAKKGGYTHVCDGTEVDLVTFDGDGKDAKATRQICPCVCDPLNRSCDTKTKLRVMLAEIPATGLWELASKGEIFADEVATTMEMWEGLGVGENQTPIFAILSLHQISVSRPGEARKDFVVSRLELDPEPKNFAQLIADTQRGALAAPVRPSAALEAPATQHTQNALPSPEEQIKAIIRDIALTKEQWQEVKEAIRERLTLGELVRAAGEAGVKGYAAMLPFMQAKLAEAKG
jgi:hypothetical protein